MIEQMLPELVRRESRSFLQYVRESFPWADGKGAGLRDKLLAMSAAEGEHIAKIGRLLAKRHIPMPGLGAYPTSFTNYNFLDAVSLVPKLLAAERQTLADLERDLFHVSDDEIRGALDALRELKRKHLAEFESLSPAKVA